MFVSPAALGESVTIVPFTQEDSEPGGQWPGARVGCTHRGAPRPRTPPEHFHCTAAPEPARGFFKGGLGREKNRFCVYETKFI